MDRIGSKGRRVTDMYNVYMTLEVTVPLVEAVSPTQARKLAVEQINDLDPCYFIVEDIPIIEAEKVVKIQ